METWCKRSSRKETVTRRKGGWEIIRKKRDSRKGRARDLARLFDPVYTGPDKFVNGPIFYLCKPFTRNRANCGTDCSIVCRSKPYTVPRVYEGKRGRREWWEEELYARSHLSSLSLLAHLARSVSRARLLPNPHLALGKCVEEADTIRLPSVFSKEHLQKFN